MGARSNFKRVKHHHFPGDVSRKSKIHMREKGTDLGGTTRGVKVWLKMLYAKTRAVLKRRWRKDLHEAD